MFALTVGSVSSYNFYLFVSLQRSRYPLQAHCLDTSDHRYSLIKQHRSGALCKESMAHNAYSFPNQGSKCTGRNSAGPGDAAPVNENPPSARRWYFAPVQVSNSQLQLSLETSRDGAFPKAARPRFCPAVQTLPTHCLPAVAES